MIWCPTANTVPPAPPPPFHPVRVLTSCNSAWLSEHSAIGGHWKHCTDWMLLWILSRRRNSAEKRREERSDGQRCQFYLCSGNPSAISSFLEIRTRLPEERRHRLQRHRGRGRGGGGGGGGGRRRRRGAAAEAGDARQHLVGVWKRTTTTRRGGRGGVRSDQRTEIVGSNPLSSQGERAFLSFLLDALALKKKSTFSTPPPSPISSFFCRRKIFLSQRPLSFHNRGGGRGLKENEIWWQPACYTVLSHPP